MMHHHLSMTLLSYIARRFMVWIAIVAVTIMALILIIDIVELLRRFHDNAMPLRIILQMALLRLPSSLHEAGPFCILIGSIVMFADITRHNELSAIRSAGVSFLECLIPCFLLSGLIGCIFVCFMNPLSSAMLNRVEKLEYRWSHESSHGLVLSSTGFWFRDAGPEEDQHSIFHVKQLDLKAHKFVDVTVYQLDKNGTFIRRIDAPTMILSGKLWHLVDASFTDSDHFQVQLATMTLPTTLSIADLKSSFSNPHTVSFWDLPNFIRSLEISGLSSLHYRMYWHNLLSYPLFLIAMVSISAVFATSAPRMGKSSRFIGGGLMIGFLIYFTTHLLTSLGNSGYLPAIIASWVPVFMCLIVGGWCILHLEETVR